MTDKRLYVLGGLAALTGVCATSLIIYGHPWFGFAAALFAVVCILEVATSESGS